ncbi:DUF3168 domain-containing protein [Pseudokordiimonas caeni]|uniref:DUF3168 domain-containing protein n=1 Tax=Pseudokordiimonas caeni TaxID=2997908 RepID=UPI0028115971|nr:DUF3168 domain-containing protein [Pseudokordiimonas caeni]
MSAFAPMKLQQAVFAALAADPTLAAKVAGIHDGPPDHARMPYIALGDTSTEDASTKSHAGQRVSFDVLVWSDAGGQMEAKELMAHADAALTASPITLEGLSLVYLRLVSSGVTRRIAGHGTQYRGRLSYRALVMAPAV